MNNLQDLIIKAKQLAKDDNISLVVDAISGTTNMELDEISKLREIVESVSKKDFIVYSSSSA